MQGSKMKVYLDDIRPIPNGWIGCRWPDEVIDLGDDIRGTGYDVLIWIEEQVMSNGFVPPSVIKVHSANPVAKARMEQAIDSIFRRAND
jgi:hypothetical protein